MIKDDLSANTPARFEALVLRHFRFLEDEVRMSRGRIRMLGESDPRDTAIAVRYSRNDLQIDVSWSQYELALIVGVRFNYKTLKRRERHVYFESFIEFVSKGAEKAIVPYLEGLAGVRSPLSVMEERQRVFSRGLPQVAGAVAAKLKGHMKGLETATPELIRSYHDWLRVTEKK